VKIRVDHDVLADAVAWTARMLPARPALPVLAGLLIEAADRLTLSSFDYEVSGRATVDADVAEPGRVLVPGRLLAEIVRSLPAHPVEISTEGAEAVVVCGSAEFGLLTIPVEDYPSLPEPPAPAGTVDGGLLATAVAQVVVAASRDDTLPMLTGVRVDIEGATVRLACTDRYRIAARELAWTPVRPDLAATAVVPARALADAAKSLRHGTEAAISLNGIGDTMMGVESGGRRMTTRLLDDQFIDYQSRFAEEWTSRAEVPTAPFIEAIKRVALVADRATPVRLAFTPGEVRIRAASGDAARGSEALPARLSGEDVDIAFNPRFLLDGLAGLSTETAVIDCAGSTRAALITGRSGDAAERGSGDTGEPAEPKDAGADGSGYRYLVMSVRLSG
jgi:DNA polymerase-3 subunit beta